jgi:AraC-like DNA-binding protein
MNVTETDTKFETIPQISELSAFMSGHPLIRVIDFEEAASLDGSQLYQESYSIFLCSPDQTEPAVLFGTPGRVADSRRFVSDQLSGKAIFFHPELISGTSLEESIRDYSFFHTSSHSILQLSSREYELILDCISNISAELKYFLDKHSKKLIARNIELCLDYCERFYTRKFTIVENNHNGILQRLDQVLAQYFLNENTVRSGIPSVAYCAGALHLSAKYLGSLVGKLTGKTAPEYIRNKMIVEAKHRVIHTHHSINEIADQLGFQYAQHFSRIFKKVVGQSPTAYRKGYNSDITN